MVLIEFYVNFLLLPLRNPFIKIFLLDVVHRQNWMLAPVLASL